MNTVKLYACICTVVDKLTRLVFDPPWTVSSDLKALDGTAHSC